MPSAVIGSLLMLTMTVVMAGAVLKVTMDTAHALDLQAQGNACYIRNLVPDGPAFVWNGAVCIEVPCLEPPVTAALEAKACPSPPPDEPAPAPSGA